MIYYIFNQQIFTIFLSMAHLTSMTFPDRINDYVGGQEGDFKIYELNSGKSLVFEAKKSGISRNFITFLKNEKFHFNVTYNEELSDKDIEVRPAKECSYFTLMKETLEYQLFECPKSLYFVNKTNKAVKLNELIIKDRSYISKGPPVYLNDKLIYLKGRAL